VTVQATDSACGLTPDSLPAGKATLRVRNEGSKVTEVYVRRADGSVVAERENIGPGTAADVAVELAAGTYGVQCKPGMAGDGITTPLTVTGGDPAGTGS